MTTKQISTLVAKDYHELSASEVSELVTIAKAEGYRKPKGTSGSYGRAYHARLRRLSDAMHDTFDAIERHREPFQRLTNR